MARFEGSDDLREAEFVDADLRGARFVRSDLSGVVIRGGDLRHVELDSPWLFEGENSLLVNGVDVLAFVDAELNRRFPGRELQRAADPEGLGRAWAALEGAWSAALERAASMPPDTVQVSVGGEWSFAQTLRHLVMATDAWLGRSVLELEQPFHPLGIAWVGPDDEAAPDPALLTTTEPTYPEVLEARASRVAMVRDFLATVAPGQLGEERRNPWAPEHAETVLSCLHVILEEEWEHLRYALRDLDAVAADPGLLDD
ncbi:MAG: DinB family protein [Motilibacteraceae bacterium]